MMQPKVLREKFQKGYYCCPGHDGPLNIRKKRYNRAVRKYFKKYANLAEMD